MVHGFCIYCPLCIRYFYSILIKGKCIPSIFRSCKFYLLFQSAYHCNGRGSPCLNLNRLYKCAVHSYRGVCIFCRYCEFYIVALFQRCLVRCCCIIIYLADSTYLNLCDCHICSCRCEIVLTVLVNVVYNCLFSARIANRKRHACLFSFFCLKYCGCVLIACCEREITNVAFFQFSRLKAYILRVCVRVGGGLCLCIFYRVQIFIRSCINCCALNPF